MPSVVARLPDGPQWSLSIGIHAFGLILPHWSLGWTSEVMVCDFWDEIIKDTVASALVSLGSLALREVRDTDTMPLGHSSGPMGRPTAWKTKASREKTKVNSHAIEILQPESRFQITAGQGCLTYILTVISRETKTEPNSQVMTKFSIYRTCVKNVCCPKRLSFGVIIRQRQVANILSDIDHRLQCFFFFNKYLFGRPGSGPHVESSSLTMDWTGPPVLGARSLSHWPTRKSLQIVLSLL